MKTKLSSIISLRGSLFVMTLLLISLLGKTYAQTDGPPIPNSTPPKGVTGHLTPGGYFDIVFDRFGNRYLLGQLAVNDSIRNAYNNLDNAFPSPAITLPTSASGHAPDAPIHTSFAPTTSSAVHLYTGCSPGYFNIYLMDGCGMDLWATDATQLARLNVMCQVLTDLSHFINSPCTTTGQKVNILVTAGLTSGLGVATPFFNMASSFTKMGIVDNTEWITINSGKDAFQGIAPPVITSGGGTTGSGTGLVFFHGSIGLNFSGSVVWNTDPIPTSFPTAGVADLYTVILHEMLHTLGFCTLIDFDGRSVFDQYNIPPAPFEFQYYSRYDMHLTDNSGANHLITNTSGCSLYQFGFNPALGSMFPFAVLSPDLCPTWNSGGEIDNTVCTQAVKYVGGPGMIPVYTPECFEKGASLSHFEDQCYVPSGFCSSCATTNNEYFVMSNEAPNPSLGGYNPITNPGVIKRYPTPEERLVLCDIGYSVNPFYGVSGSLSTMYTGLAGPNLNYYAYTGASTCPGINVVGFNDGLSGGSYTFTTSSGVGITINGGGSSLLDNDVQGTLSLSAAGGSFTCLEVMTGTGTVSATSGTTATLVTYTPSTSDAGIELLRYIPVSSTGVKGNITYIYVFVGSPDCRPTPCDLVVNGGFELPATGAWGEMMFTHEDCWLPVNYIPEILAADAPTTSGYYLAPTDVHPLSLPTNHHELRNYEAPSGGYSYWGVSSAQEQLSTPLLPGQQYTLSFWARAGAPVGPLTHFEFAVGNTFPLIGTTFISSGYLPTGFTVLNEFLATDFNWHPYSYTFTFPATASPSNVLFFQGVPWDDPLIWSGYTGKNIEFDDISIIPASSGCTFTIPGPICSSTPPFNLNTVASVGVPGGTFSWPTLPIVGGVPTTSTSSIFDPLAAYNASIAIGGTGLIPVAYTYTTSIGCVLTVYTELQITGPSPITGPTTLCTGSTIALTDATSGGTWSSSNTSVATVDPTGLVGGVSAGTSTIIYTLSTGCYTTMVVTVTPMPVPITGILTVCAGSTTALTDATGGGTWSSSNTSVATVDPTGVVSGVSAGTSTIIYATGTGCYATAVLTVMPLPVVTTNPSVIFCGPVLLTAYCTTGVTYSWSPATGLSGVSGSSVWVIGPLPPGMTVYTVTVTDAYGCTSTALDTVIVLCTQISCQSISCNASAAGSPAITPIGGTVGAAGATTYMPPGTYYAYADIHFLGNVIFQSSVIAIAPAVTMYVDARSDLELVDCHLFSCTMWHGIVLQSDLTNNSGNLHLSGNTLIEDADIAAVTINDGVMPSLPCLTCPASMLPTVLSADGAIFNRNIVGVAITRFPSATATAVPSPPANYPFLVRNTVFTSRDFSNYSDGFQHYPCVWPMTDGTSTSLKATGTWTPPGFPLTSPYNIDNPAAGGTGVSYPFILCKSGASADIGIALTQAGRYRPVPLSLTMAAYYSTITVGDAAATAENMYQNLFDKLHQGISLQYSNVNCYGNSFTHMYPGGTPISGGVVGSAPYLPPSLVTHPLAPHMLCQILLRGTISMSPAATIIPYGDNIFYDCQNGVWARDYYDVTGYGAAMFSNHGAFGVPTTSGVYGYDLFSRKFHAINLTNNLLTNIYYTGILINSQAATLTSGGIAGSIAVNSNTINANYAGTVPTGQELYNAITVSNVGTGTVYTTIGSVQVDTNKITYAYYGIDVENYKKQMATSNMNTIGMMMNPGPPATTIPLQQQYGIHHANNWKNRIQYNNITGDDRFGTGWYSPFISPTTYGSGAAADRAIVGVYGFQNTNAMVTCNVVNHSTTGFQFYGTPNTTSWLDNTMHRNEYGYVLKGAIGNQGSLTQPSDNLWVGPPLGGGWWWDYGTPNYGTFTVASPTPTLSTIYIRPGSTGTTTVYDPANNSGRPAPPPVVYGFGCCTTGNGLVVVPSFSAIPTPPCETQWPFGLAFMPVLHAAAQQTIGPIGPAGSVPGSPTDNWMAQMGLWDNILADTTIADSSGILRQFSTMAGTSRYAWLTNIDNALSDEDITTATTLLGTGLDADTTTATDTVTGVMMADGALADAVTQNYYNFYNIYLRYLMNSMTSADSALLVALANLCPVRDGAIVYEARGLYRILYDDPGFFNDNCDTTGSSGCDTCGPADRRIRPGGNGLAMSVQQYWLFPDPNDGSFVLQQQLDDNNPVSLEVLDAAGRVVYKNARAFTDKKMMLQIENAPPGLYLLELVDSKGKRYTLKFVVAK